MKQKKYIYTFKNKLLFAFLASSQFVYAQPGPGDLGSPPDLPSGGGEMGGSAPIDGGIWLLLAFALFYLLFKYRKELSEIYNAKRNLQRKEEFAVLSGICNSD